MYRIAVVGFEPSDSRCGRHVEHDERSWNYRALPKEAKPQRKTTHWTSRATVLNQGERSSCTGNATAQWLNTDFATAVQVNANHGKQFDEPAADQIYSKATKLDAIPGSWQPDDTGSTGNAAAKAARFFGFLKSYGWLFSFTSVQAAIERTPLTTGTLWTNNMFTPKNGIVTVGKLNDSNIAGGHQYLMSGIDYVDELFEFRNSWGDQDVWKGCKPGGYFAMSFHDYQTLLEADGDVTVPKWS